MPNSTNPEAYLDQAIAALSAGRFRPVLDAIPVPIYTTDADGLVTYWNQACVEFAGREPELGSDRWCVTWQIHTTTGERLPHEQCPMAQAIREQRCIRNAVAIALRPDGSRRAFRPYPTPLTDDGGKLTGAVNMLIDVTTEQASALSLQAGRCRRLANATLDRETAEILATMAGDYERTALALEGKAHSPAA